MTTLLIIVGFILPLIVYFAYAYPLGKRVRDHIRKNPKLIKQTNLTKSYSDLNFARQASSWHFNMSILVNSRKLPTDKTLEPLYKKLRRAMLAFLAYWLLYGFIIVPLTIFNFS